jgi:hypothetical protein
VATYNILKDYDWTSIPKGSSLRNNAPRVKLTSYKITSNEALNRLTSYIDIVASRATGGSAEEFYNKLYGKVTKEEDDFIIPYFSDSIRSFSNDWGDTFQAGFLGTLDSAANGGFNAIGAFDAMNPIKNAQQFLENAGPLMSNIASGKNNDGAKESLKKLGDNMSSNPGSYIETPKMYQYAQNDAPLDISFIIANTINENSVDDNYNLVKHLTKINRPTRINSIEMEPPRIYSVKLDGHRFMRWAYCSSFSVNMLGTKRMIDGKIVPEGYMINMSLTSLTTEVSNFMDKV